MFEPTRRRVLRLFAMAPPLVAGLPALPAAAADEGPVRIGYAISLTGPNSGGGITTLPNYRLRVKEANDAGGLELPDKSYGHFPAAFHTPSSPSKPLAENGKLASTRNRLPGGGIRPAAPRDRPASARRDTARAPPAA